MSQTPPPTPDPLPGEWSAPSPAPSLPRAAAGDGARPAAAGDAEGSSLERELGGGPAAGAAAPGPAEPPASDGAARPGPASRAGVVIGEDGLARPAWASVDPLLRDYNDTEWGMPVLDERGLFERLSLEAFQSGLSWATILRKRPAFRAAFADFDPDAVAAFGEGDVARLMADAGIVRNRRKIDATITNARATVALRADGGLPELLWSAGPPVTPAPATPADVPTTSPESVALAKELKRRGFAFVGPTTMFALMEAAGIVDTHLLSSHRRGTSGVFDEAGRRRPTRGGSVPAPG